MKVHFCHIPLCSKATERRALMCPEHWHQVPVEIQAEVKQHFNPDQLHGKVRPTKEYLKAARKAINHVRGIK